MLHEIEPRRYDNTFRIKAPAESDYLLYYEKNTILLRKIGEVLSFPDFSVLPNEMWPQAEYLFSIDDTGFFLFQGPLDAPAEPLVMLSVQQIRDTDEAWMGFAGVTGWQLSRWKNNHKFCSRCGEPMAASVQERALVCPACGLIEYPRISPAVIVAVTDGDRLLMIKPKHASADRYNLVAGFIEIGETMEQAAAREVKEEAGIEIGNIRYYKNQPWSFSDTLIIGFTAQLCGDDALRIQESEVADAKWFSRCEVQKRASVSSITGELINGFIAGAF